MHWLKRTLRASIPSSPQRPQPRPRARLGIEALEDRSVPTAAGMISGSAFFDNNGNSIKDGSDFAVTGASVSLSGTTNFGTAVNSSVTTDANGAFKFLKLEPGVYQVSTPIPNGAGTAGTLGGAGGTSLVQTIVVGQGETEANIRFIFTGVASAPSSFDSNSISLRLFLNTNLGDPALHTQNKVLVDYISNNSTHPDTEFATAFVKPAGTGQTIVDGSNGSQASGSGSLAGTVQTTDASPTGIAGITMQLTGVDKNGVSYLRTTTTDSSGNYSFTSLAPASYFINVLPTAGFRAAGGTVGSLGGSAPRADQLAPTILNNGSGVGYNFKLAAFATADELDAGLANDVGNGSLGTSSDGNTSDPSIRGRLLNPTANSALEARFTAGATTDFVSVKTTLAADGSFNLNEQTMRDVFGGGFPDGAYTVEIRATSKTGTVVSKSVSFTLTSSGPRFLASYANLSSAVAAADTTLILAGGFTDPDIVNSLVTFNVLKGATAMSMNVELYDKDSPRSVANFFNYLTRYASNGGTLFHRLHEEATLNVLQGGGYTFDSGTNTISAHITQDPTIINEFSTDRPNSRGSLATAKLGGDPDSASSEYYFNLTDSNASTLSVNNNGGFTVFGNVQSDADLAVLDDLASVPIKNTGGQSELPLVDGNTLDANNVERLQSVTVVNRDNELTYSVVSSNTAVVTVSTTAGAFQGNQITLHNVAAGSSTITVTATDSTGKTSTSTFIVTVT